MELLAPAGNLDAAFAAFHYGADAIYLGLKKFSARAEAENFTLTEVAEITAFARAQPRRRSVFITVNTLALQRELPELIETLGALSDIGVDALIIQDLGVYYIVRRYFPELQLHASTQLAAHHRAGAETLKAMGFRRVILARELTLNEIREIAAITDLEIEVFVHGALCYAYSGLCLLSSQLTGRSGNRGRCTYACRDRMAITGAPETLRDGTRVKRDPRSGFAFSMKDLALPDYLPALRTAGVSALKIEGRKKSPLYVATTTDYYRQLLDGKLTPQDRAAHEADMKTVFSRPWTRLFVQSHKDKEVADRDTVGHRGNPIGVVGAVVRGGSGGTWLRFKTAQAIERHDGLQIDVPGLGKPFGFAVNALRLVKSMAEQGSRVSVFEAPAGAMIEVALPAERPEIPIGATVYCASSQSVKRRYRYARPKPGQFSARRAMDVTVALTESALTVTARIEARHSHEDTIEVCQTLPGPFGRAQDAAKTTAAARAAFEKLGQTSLALRHFTLDNPGDCFVPLSQLNALRRKITETVETQLTTALTNRAQQVKDVICGASVLSPIHKQPFRWSVKVDRCGFLDAFEADDWRDLDEVVIDIDADQFATLAETLSRLAAIVGRDRIRLALPAITRLWEERGLRQKIERLRADGWSKWEAANLSAWTFLDLNLNTDPSASTSIDLSADWSIYVVNRAAALQALAMGARRLTLSPEDGLENMRSLLSEFAAQATVIVYQDTPLLIAESCAYANIIGGCPGKRQCRFESMDMVNGYGERMTALDYHCRTIVINRDVYCLAPRLKDMAASGAMCMRAEFMYRRYKPEESRDVWRLVRAGKNVSGGQIANFDRGLL
ncbi:MAG: U32 family peptidase [Planctomycetota bacterium]